MRTIALALLLAAAAAAAAASPKAGDAAPAVSVKDVKDRSVSAPVTGSAMVLSFGSRSTGETAGEITRAVRVAHPEVTILSFIDLSGFPGFMRGTIKSTMAGRQAGAVKEAKAAFEKAGKTPPDDLDLRIHIIADFDASACKAYGANDTGHQAQIVVVRADGTIAAIFDKTPKAADVITALEKALAPK